MLRDDLLDRMSFGLLCLIYYLIILMTVHEGCIPRGVRGLNAALIVCK
jgi:hypothetical protein